MANSKYIKGSDLMLFVNGKSIAGATNHTLSISAETTELSTKCKDEKDGSWSEAEISKYSWEATTENLVTFTDYGVGGTYNTLFDAMTNGTEVTLVMSTAAVVAESEKAPDPATAPKNDGYSPASDGLPYLTGTAFITSLQLNAQDGEVATFTATFTGNGKLTRTK